MSEEILKKTDLNSDLALLRRAGKWGISGSTFKIIAIITMFIDHLAASVVSGVMFGGTISLWVNQLAATNTLMNAYAPMRTIGRIAFPIFCFLLVQGYKHTSDFKKYALRLFIFALISEIPFDLNMIGVFGFQYQNVFFTLLLGLLNIRILDEYQGREIKHVLIRVASTIVFSVLATYLRTDYAFFGVIAITLLYLFDNSNIQRTVAGFIAFSFEASYILVYIPVILFNFYNGQRGLKLKYFFYIFYPLHLLILYFLKTYLLTGNIF